MNEAEDHGATTPKTKAEEEREAHAEHVPDRPPTAAEEEAADESRDRYADDADEVAENTRSAAERGANVKGEGQIT
jgi:hypothetical protein